MTLRNTLLTLACAATIASSAVPARRGAVYEMQQPDGTTVSLRIVGDEHCHYYLTLDGKVVVSNDGKYCYANLDEQGRFAVTDVMAHNEELRSTAETAIASKINADAVINQLIGENREIRQQRVNSQNGNGKIPGNFPTTGEIRSLVMLVEFSDKEFTIDNPYEYFHNLLNQPGFSEYNAVGSARDYFLDASDGQFIPQFDVFGPVKLSQPISYYGKDYGTSVIDANIQTLVLDASKALDDQINYSDYDLDNDGFVDNIVIFYAGRSQADGGGSESIWPQQSQIGFNIKYRFDGVQVNRFVVTSGLTGDLPEGIGTFCHEFSHVLGLPDLYNINDAYDVNTPGEFDIMEQGAYNVNGRIPPTLSAYERNALGWMSESLVEITGPASCRLEHLLTSNAAYLVNTDNPNEYFLFENRQKKGWDQSIPANGMLVWHIDYNKNIFLGNTANSNPSHQRVDIVEAGGSVGSNNLVRRSYPFPGSKKVKNFVYGGTPSFESWSGKDLGLPITNITEAAGVITFDVAGGGLDPAGIESVTTDDTLSYSIEGNKINVVAKGRITISDLCGRTIATGNNALTVEAHTPGLYIISTKSGSAKLTIK